MDYGVPKTNYNRYNAPSTNICLHYLCIMVYYYTLAQGVKELSHPEGLPGCPRVRINLTYFEPRSIHITKSYTVCNYAVTDLVEVHEPLVLLDEGWQHPVRPDGRRPAQGLSKVAEIFFSCCK